MKPLLMIFILSTSCLEYGHVVPSTMKVIALKGLGGTRVMEICQCPLPNIADNQVLVKIKAAGINPVDVHMRSGKCPLNQYLPPILGKEIAGIVEEVDPSVTKFKLGDRVFCTLEMGGYAEYAAVDSCDCYPLADRLNFSQGAAIYITYFTACRALLKAQVQKNDTVLIHGCSGSLGMAAIQLAKIMGAYVIATVGSPTLVKLATNAGCDHVTFHTVKDHLQGVLDKLGIRGFEVILEVFSNIDLPNDKKYLNSNGRIVILENRAVLPIDGQDLCVENGTLHSVALFKYTREEQDAAADFVLRCIDKNLLTPVVAQEYLLDQAPRAHFDIMQRKGASGKLVFVL